MRKFGEFARSESHTRVISLVVPVFNERLVLPLFFERVFAVIDALPFQWELVMVDDGSQDGSVQFIRQMIKQRAEIRLVKLSRNFGKEAAVTAGLAQAKGDAVIVLDADLQDPPEHIGEMVERWQTGVEVVLMQRSSRAGESWFKRWTASAFYRLLRLISPIEIPVDTGDFRLMSRKAVDAVLRLQERNRYMKGLFAWVGMSTAVIRYDREPRTAGKTKWDYSALMGLAFEGITSFSVAPLRWVTGLGVMAAALGGCFGIWIVIKTVLLGSVVNGYASIVAVMSFLGGMQLLSLGLLGEYVAKIYLETKQRPLYLIEDVVESSTALSQQNRTEWVERSYAKAV